MSAGAKSYLNEEKLKPLANRKVILFPDTNAFEDWTTKAKDLRSIVPNLKVSDYLEKLLSDEQKKEGYDIADFLIEQRRKEVWSRELYNRKVDLINAEESLRTEFEMNLEERKAIMIIEGGLSENEAEAALFSPQNIQSLVLDFAF